MRSLNQSLKASNLIIIIKFLPLPSLSADKMYPTRHKKRLSKGRAFNIVMHRCYDFRPFFFHVFFLRLRLKITWNSEGNLINGK